MLYGLIHCCWSKFVIMNRNQTLCCFTVYRTQFNDVQLDVMMHNLCNDTLYPLNRLWFSRQFSFDEHERSHSSLFSLLYLSYDTAETGCYNRSNGCCNPVSSSSLWWSRWVFISITLYKIKARDIKLEFFDIRLLKRKNRFLFDYHYHIACQYRKQ